MLSADWTTLAGQIEAAAMTCSARAGAKVCPQSVAMKNKGCSGGNLEQNDRHFDHSGGCEVIQDEVTTGRMSIQESLLPSRPAVSDLLLRWGRAQRYPAGY
jgi:hypothetical protein